MKFNPILGGIEGLKEPLLLLCAADSVAPANAAWQVCEPTFKSDISRDQLVFKLLRLSSGVIQLIHQRAFGLL